MDFDNPQDFDTNSDRETTSTPRVPAWLGSFVLLGLIGVLAIELTSDPLLGTAIACSKLGWSDFRTAFWVRHRDPFAGRGRSLFWFLLAAGICRVMVWSVVLAVGLILFAAVLVVLVLPHFGAEGQALAKLLDDGGLAVSLVNVGVIGGLAFVPAVCMTAIGCLTAKRHGIQIWMDSSLARAYREQSWPPRNDGEINRCDRLLLIVASVCVFVSIECIVLANTMLPPPYGEIVAVSLMAIVPPAGFFLGRSVIALCARDCWDPDLPNGENTSSSDPDSIPRGPR